MIVDSKSDLGMWVHQLREDPVAALSELGSQTAIQDCDLFSSEQLHHAFDHDGSSKISIQGLAKELRRSDFKQVHGGEPVRTAAKLMRLYAIRNEEKWMSAEPKDIAAHWNKYFVAGGKY
jgi:hypothetical protein